MTDDKSARLVNLERAYQEARAGVVKACVHLAQAEAEEKRAHRALLLEQWRG